MVSTRNHSPSPVSPSNVELVNPPDGIPTPYQTLIQHLQTQILDLQSQLTESQSQRSESGTDMVTTLARMQAEISELKVQIPTPNPPPALPQPPIAQLPKPDQFSGDRSKFRQWFCQVTNYLRIYSTGFTSDTMRVGLFTSLMTESALLWLMPYVESKSYILDNFEGFIEELKRAFDDPDRGKSSSKALKILRQQQFNTFSEYESRFRLLAQDVDWTESSKVEQFRLGLDSNVEHMLLMAETCGTASLLTLNDVIRAAATIAVRFPATPVTAPLPNTPPRDTNSRDEERRRRRQLGLCLYCGGQHMIAKCPALANRQSSFSLNSTHQP